MYGKAYEAMYEGSMVGAGLNVFAVWNYCIAKNRLGVVELNPKLLGFILGGEKAETQVQDAIDKLCAPDPNSRSKDEQGRRLVREGQFQYRMVNWFKYDKIKSETDRREYNRVKQQEHRAKKKARRTKAQVAAGYSAGERAYEASINHGASEHESDAIANRINPLPECSPVPR